MEMTKLMRCALCTAVLAALVLVGCSKLDFYSIDAPSDLQYKIDSIEAAKPDPGDTTFIPITSPIVGAEDNTSAWDDNVFSDFFSVPANKQLILQFVNYGSGAGNWNNWNLFVANAERDATGYAEYFVLRSDAWGWGNDDFDRSLISIDYPDTDGDLDIWNDFRTTMQGAFVTIVVDHSVTGYVFVTATAVGTNGTTLVETYKQPVSATDDIVAFLKCDGSHFEMKRAYLLPSTHTVLEDFDPVSIAVTGAPIAVEIGNENFWGDAIATVTYADGSSAEVDSADISFTVVPDMSTLGKKTVVVAYGKTRQGEYCQPVSTFYTLNVVNPVVSLAITTMPENTTYAFYGTEAPAFDATGLVVTATYSDGTTGIIDNTTLDFEIPLVAGSQNAVISYVGATSTVTTNCPLTIIEGTAQVGATDFSTGFWGAHSADYTVASGTSKTITFYTYSNEVENWKCPITVLRAADYTEYAVTRWDWAGWGNGFGTAVLSADWNWDTFKSNISGSKTVLTVTNNGDNTADVRYDVTYPDGVTTHYQLYEGITVTSSDLTFAITVENCYHVIVNN